MGQTGCLFSTCTVSLNDHFIVVRHYTTFYKLIVNPMINLTLIPLIQIICKVIQEAKIVTCRCCQVTSCSAQDFLWMHLSLSDVYCVAITETYSLALFTSNNHKNFNYFNYFLFKFNFKWVLQSTLNKLQVIKNKK